MEACLDEELPPTTELEEGLRNGVYLAKLGNFFAPQVVSLKRIYDREQTRYKVKAEKENSRLVTAYRLLDTLGIHVFCFMPCL